MPFDPVADFTPVALVAATPLAIAVHPALPATDLKSLLALARQAPERLNVASFGNGTIAHLASELLQSMAGVTMTHVPYKGATPAMTDLIAGQVQLAFDSASSALVPARAGRVRLIAVTSTRRIEAAPDVPTVAEAGVPGYEAVTWFGLLGPANLPASVVATLSGRLATLLAQPGLRADLIAQGNEPRSGRADDLASVLASDYAKWAKLAREIRLKLD